jgi:hypothetical protein
VQFAIQDMLKIIAYPVNNNRVLRIFLSRQIVTLFKHGSPKLKLSSIASIAKGIKVDGRGFFLIFLNEFSMSLKKQVKFGRSH